MTPTRKFFLPTLLLATILGISSAIAGAIPVPNSDTCPAETSGGKILSCTSQDIEIAEVSAKEGVENPTECLVGSQVNLFLEVLMSTNANSGSPNVGVWFAQDAENLLIPSEQPGGAASCLSSPLPFPIDAESGQFPNLVDDYDDPTGTDFCGDVAAQSKGEQFRTNFGEVAVDCDGAVGGAEIDAIVSWHEKKHPVCDDPTDENGYGGFNTSKCNLSTTFFDLDVFGKLTIVKLASDAGELEFGFDSSNAVSVEDLETLITQFYLGDGDSQDLAALLGTTVTVTESELPELWGLASISCVNNDPRADGVPITFNRDGNTLTITLTEGNLASNPEPGAEDYGQSDVTCFFRNTRGGSITISKNTVPDGSQAFQFSSSQLGAFTLDDDGNDEPYPSQISFDELVDGSFQISESQVGGFDLTDISCEIGGQSTLVYTPSENSSYTAGDTGIDIGMTQSDNVSCVFTNTQRGGIIVAKQTDPDGDPLLFTFSGSAAGMIGDGQTIEVLDLMPGAYTSEETVPTGWDLVSIVCDDNNSGANKSNPAQADFNVEPGEVVTCTFLNVKQGSIIVEKEANGDDGLFNFSRSWGEDFDITTSGGSESRTFDNLPASDEVAQDTYSVAEINRPDRWDYDGVSCGEEDANAIDLDPGETVTCTFTNTKWASLKIVKLSLGLDDRFCFDITWPGIGLLGNDENCLTTVQGRAEEFEDDIEFGDYSFVEIPDETGFWTLLSASCTNGDTPDDLTIGAGDDVTCTFINGIPNPIPTLSQITMMLLILLILAGGLYQRRLASRER